MSSPPKQVGRYMLFDEIASGGMGSVRLGRLLGPAGFSRIVVIKSLHAFGESAADWQAMLLDEARLASRVRHPNVVPIIDVIEDQGVHLVMDYIEGESLSLLLRASEVADRRLAPRLALGVLHGILLGLHAAHEARSERGTPLGIVHRDVSPQNVLVGADGTPRLIDFGVAKAQVRLTDTKDGVIKGKIAYMAPELLRGEPFDRRVDVYAASVMLWELLVGQRLFDSSIETALMPILTGRVTPPKQLVPSLPGGLDAIVMKGLAPRAEQRFQTAAEMAEALEPFAPFASSRELGELVRKRAGPALAKRNDLVAHAELVSTIEVTPAVTAREPTVTTTPAPVVAPLPSPSAPRALPDLAPLPDARASQRHGVHGGPARRRTSVVLAAFAAVLALVAAWWLSQSRAPTSVAEARSGTAEPVRSSLPLAVPPLASSTAPAARPAAPLAPGEAPTTSAAAPVSPPPSAVARPTAPAPAPTQGRKPAASSAPSCDPPFSLTAGGVKVPKPGCF